VALAFRHENGLARAEFARFLALDVDEERAFHDIEQLIALQVATPVELAILNWLKAPKKHFPPQIDGDLVTDGVCVILIARKLKVSQPTATAHLKVLAEAGLVRARRIKQWTFYKRDEGAIAAMKAKLDRV
jgi:DNA-binding transcriptional ArsR family regulator